MDFVKKLAASRTERAAVVAAQRASLEKAETEKREFLPAEEADYQAADVRLTAIDIEIARLEKLIADERTSAGSKIETKSTKSDRGEYGENAVKLRYKTLRGFKDEKTAYAMGMWTRGAVFGDQRAAQWCSENGIETRASGEAIFGQAGALVPEQMATAIIDLREQYGVARQMLKIFPMGSDTLTIRRRRGGLTGFFVAEGVAPTVSDKTWDTVTLTAKRLAALSLFSRELADDAVIDVGADLAEEMAYAFANKEDDCWLNGDGTSNFGGIFGILPKIIDGTHTASAINAVATHNTFSTITNADLTNLMGALPVYASGDVDWLVSQRGRAMVFGALTAAAGGNSMITLAGRSEDAYLGDPIMISQLMPRVTTSLINLAMVLYGNFELASCIGDRRGFSLQVLNERYAELGQIGVIGWERFDIANHDLGDNVNPGPVVALIGA